MSTTRLSVNINSETAQALQDLASRHGTSVTEIVRRAIGVYKFVDDETQKPDTTLQLVSENAKERAIIHLV